MGNIGELMYESFMNGMYQSFIIVGSYIMGPLIVTFIGVVIKKISEGFTYYFSIVSGDSRRIARKKAKKMSKMENRCFNRRSRWLLSAFEFINKSISGRDRAGIISTFAICKRRHRFRLWQGKCKIYYRYVWDAS